MSLPERLLDDEQRIDWLQLSRSENVGPVLFYQLINRYGSAAAALRALPGLARRGGRKALRIYPRERAIADLEAAARCGARFVARGEAGYPPLLRHVDGPPPLLCIRGRAGLAELPPVAMVGARNASAAGMKLARTLAHDVGRSGYVVVSGLARGIDTAAHEGALETGTIAVLAGGIDRVYPRENAALMERIAENGLLVTEMTPGTAPRAEFFPRRNRLVAGMSLGVVVIEAAMRSGSLITARLAAEQGREVMAVPGSPLDPRAAGTLKLLRQGATLITSATDIVETLAPLAARPLPEARPLKDTPPPDGGLPAPGPDTAPPRKLHQLLLSLLGPGETDLDDLIRESGHPPGMVLAAIMELELAGMLTQPQPGRIARCT
jgi:DNA processing protein